MANKVKGIPDNSSRVIPRLVCTDGAGEIDFCVNTFDAVELNRRPGPDGMMAHALLTIGPEMIMIEGEWPTLPNRAPKPDGSSPVMIFVYVEDVDKTVERAATNGAQVLSAPQDQFWGDRSASIMDPAGHVWTVASRIEDTTPQERTDRWSAILNGKAEDSDTGCSFTIEEMRGDDPRLRQILEVPEKEKQSSYHATIQLLPGSEELEIENVRVWDQFQLTADDFTNLQSLGLKGKLRVTGWGTSGYAPYRSRTLIVAQHQIKEAVDLPQPDECQVIYYQAGDGWRKFPEDAPTLKKRFRLSIDRANKDLTNMWAEEYFGSDTGGGGGAFGWKGVG